MKNVILALKICVDCVERVSKISQKVVNYFFSQFKEPHYDLPHLDGFSRSLFEEDNVGLTAPFLVFEID